MSGGSRWPDITRVSSLFNPFGSKGTASSEAGTSNADNEARNTNDASNKDGDAAQFDMMTDMHGQPIDGMGDFDERYGDDAPEGMESDFPPLEMFDSNAAEAPFSSINAASYESNNQAPTASMSVEEPSATKKSKKDKKKKKKAAEGEQPREEGAHKRAKRMSIDHEDAIDTPESARAGSIELGEEPNASAQQSKRKRKSSDGESSKRKKRKAQGVPEAVEEAVEDDDAAAFLHKDPKSGTAQLAAAVEEEAAAESDPQRSPTVAHLRRRSQSRSREPSAQRDDPTDSQEVENVARQAWEEHVNGNANGGTDAADVSMTDAKDDADDAAQDGSDSALKEETGAVSRRKSSRKKAKPTFFDQPPADEDLPSPAAMTPKPRKRAKPATKKQKPHSPKLSYSMDGGDDDGFEEDQPKRKNRMEGFTKGRFTDDEMARIRKQIKEFGEEHDLTPFQVNEMIHEPGGTQAGERHQQLWSRLFAECPDRHRQKVINITRKKFHNYVARGTWTPEQDQELRQLIDVHGTSWSKIGQIINRHPEDLRDRYRNYIVCGDKQKKDAWTQEEEGELAMHIVASMASIDELRAMQPNRQLLQKSYEELIDWQNISELMGRKRSRLQCITKWKAMNLKTHSKDKFASLQPDAQITFDLEKARRQLTEMPVAERYRLVLAISKTSASADSKVPWSKLCDRAWRLEWPRKMQILLWTRLKKTVPGWERMSTRDAAQYLVDQYDREGELPDVDGENYNDIEEMQALQANATPHARSDAKKKAKSTEAISDERVADADMEDDEQPAEQQELQIDPALVSAIEQAADATKAAEAATAEEAAAAAGEVAAAADDAAVPHAEASPFSKKTPGKKTATYGKKRASAKKPAPMANMLSQDPIEDPSEPSQELPELPPQDTQEEVNDPAPKKRRSAKGARARGKRRAKGAEMVNEGVSSDLDDGMEDLPATVEDPEAAQEP